MVGGSDCSSSSGVVGGCVIGVWRMSGGVAVVIVGVEEWRSGDLSS